MLRVKDDPPLFLASASQSQHHQQQTQQQTQQPQPPVVDEPSSGADTPSDDLHRLSDLDGHDQSFQAESAANTTASVATKKSHRRQHRSDADHYSKEELNLIESFLETSVEIGGDDDDDPLERALEKVLEDGAEAVRDIYSTQYTDCRPESGLLTHNFQ